MHCVISEAQVTALLFLGDMDCFRPRNWVGSTSGKEQEQSKERFSVTVELCKDRCSTHIYGAKRKDPSLFMHLFI